MYKVPGKPGTLLFMYFRNVIYSMRIICLMLLTVGFFACKATKEKKQTAESMTEAVENITEEKPQMNEMILGDWTWWKTDCCSRMPHTTYAKEMPYERTLTFSKGGKL